MKKVSFFNITKLSFAVIKYIIPNLKQLLIIIHSVCKVIMQADGIKM